jgi:hypothetical protein
MVRSAEAYCRSGDHVPMTFPVRRLKPSFAAILSNINNLAFRCPLTPDQRALQPMAIQSH